MWQARALFSWHKPATRQGFWAALGQGLSRMRQIQSAIAPSVAVSPDFQIGIKAESRK
jgi:hypothetical protein